MLCSNIGKRFQRLLFFVLLSGLGSTSCFSQEKPIPIYPSELKALATASQALKAQLVSSLETLKLSDQTRERLQQDLQVRQTQIESILVTSKALELKLALSQTESQTLKEDLTTLKQSFSEYKNEVQRKIDNLATQNYIFGAAGVAVGGAIFFVLHLFGVIK